MLDGKEEDEEGSETDSTFIFQFEENMDMSMTATPPRYLADDLSEDPDFDRSDQDEEEGDQHDEREHEHEHHMYRMSEAASKLFSSSLPIDIPKGLAMLLDGIGSARDTKRSGHKEPAASAQGQGLSSLKDSQLTDNGKDVFVPPHTMNDSDFFEATKRMGNGDDAKLFEYAVRFQSLS